MHLCASACSKTTCLLAAACGYRQSLDRRSFPAPTCHGAGSAQRSLLVSRPLFTQPDDFKGAVIPCSSTSDTLAGAGFHPSSSSEPGGVLRSRGDDDDETDFGHDVEATARELLACSELVQQMGPGFVYLGSSRIQEDHSFFLQSRDLSTQVHRKEPKNNNVTAMLCITCYLILASLKHHCPILRCAGCFFCPVSMAAPLPCTSSVPGGLQASKLRHFMLLRVSLLFVPRSWHQCTAPRRGLGLAQV